MFIKRHFYHEAICNYPESYKNKSKHFLMNRWRYWVRVAGSKIVLVGAVGPKNGAKTPKIFLNCNFMACDTVDVGRCIFLFSLEGSISSSMSFRREDWTGSDAAGVVFSCCVVTSE
jgi:hypothetical protein